MSLLLKGHGCQAAIPPLLLQASVPLAAAGIQLRAGCCRVAHPWGHAWVTSGDIYSMGAWLPKLVAAWNGWVPPIPQDVGAWGRWVPGGIGCRSGGCLDLGWSEQGVSDSGGCGPWPAQRAKGSALACRSYSRNSGTSRKSSRWLFPGGL